MSANTATRHRVHRSICGSPPSLPDLRLAALGQHDHSSDALMTAMMYVYLTDLKQRGVASRAGVQGLSPTSAARKIGRRRR
jgi:hypothetical protein